MPELVHATAIAIDGRAALLRGPSGSGKSDLAVRCIMTPLMLGGRLICAHLVADDQVLVERRASDVVVAAPPTIAGRIEVRGIGLENVPFSSFASLALVVDLVPGASVERLPEPTLADILGVGVPLVRIAPFEASAPMKLALALQRAARAASA